MQSGGKNEESIFIWKRVCAENIILMRWCVYSEPNLLNANGHQIWPARTEEQSRDAGKLARIIGAVQKHG